jgi:hypothetical protein
MSRAVGTIRAAGPAERPCQRADSGGPATSTNCGAAKRAWPSRPAEPADEVEEPWPAGLGGGQMAAFIKDDEVDAREVADERPGVRRAVEDEGAGVLCERPLGDGDPVLSGRIVSI